MSLGVMIVDIRANDQAQPTRNRSGSAVGWSALLCADFLNIFTNLIYRRLKNLKTDFGSMLSGLKARAHLLKRMYIVPEVPQGVAKLLRIVLNQAQFSCNINETTETPIVKLFHFPVTVLWRGFCGVELPWMIGG